MLEKGKGFKLLKGIYRYVMINISLSFKYFDGEMFLHRMEFCNEIMMIFRREERFEYV